MWICSKLGFFSVARRGSAECWEIRARMDQDLRELLAASGLNTEILRTPDSDYRFRIEVDRGGFERLMGILAETVDYASFQDAVRSLASQRGKLPAYETLSEALRQIQNESGGKSDEAQRRGSARSPEDIARRSGGHLARMLETLNGFREKYGHWPRRLRLSHKALESLRNRYLTDAGF